MIKLQTRPFANFYTPDGARYQADAAGVLLAEPQHVASLVNAGCARTCLTPLGHTEPAPASPPAPKPLVKTVALRAPAPFQAFAPASGVRYMASDDGLIHDVHPGHVKALLRAGCSELDALEATSDD
jgi:hypothetical protein